MHSSAASSARRRVANIRADIQAKSKPSGWVLPKERASFAEEDDWTNIDQDVTPLERRTWTSWTILGFWMSDAMNAQGWAAPSSIIAVGLTWREAIYCIIIGSSINAAVLVLNGAIGAHLRVPFPVAIRSSFGFYFARFAVIIRMCTALFWHAIQTYAGSTAMTQCIRAIFPSYLDIPNHLPASAGITSQQLLSHFIFWSIQFPFLLIPPHKLRWFFLFKIVITVVTSVAVVIAMVHKAGGTGDIWNQDYQVSGSDRSWLILSSMMSICGLWATMSVNIPDFTRYLRSPKGVYWQGLILPTISIVLGLFGIISTSCSKVVYDEYIWDPIELASRWDGPSGRAGAFFVGLCWVVAQIGTNLSANVISYANDMVSLFPKYINIRRGAIFATIIAGWAMVPWKIVASAQSLLTFVAGLAVFLGPISSILACDYWLVKRRAIDVPSLYRRNGRYKYVNGYNWRAAVAIFVALIPNLPGLAQAVSPDIQLDSGIRHLYDINYLYGCSSAAFLYWLLSWVFPATDTLLASCIYEDDDADAADLGKHAYSTMNAKDGVEVSIAQQRA